MADQTMLAREWVEVQEESSGDRLVLRPLDYPVAPTRGGRRHLDLSTSGAASNLAQGATDEISMVSEGGWSLQEDILRLDLEGWNGTYEVEEIGDKILVLRRR
ncbi:hypothetical protein [Roseovarius aestuariivivens]|uniref:hypothetical protein n=1 Tax=Roseovarius aestuariivivens TaxID=1888910 RepID=UPI0010801179|nr:hypothetical protein [Roseovarius aestuariivivens]